MKCTMSGVQYEPVIQSGFLERLHSAKNIEESPSMGPRGCNLNARGRGQRLLWDMDEYTL